MLFDVNWFRMTALKGCVEVCEMVPVERIQKEQIKSWNSDELFIGMTILLIFAKLLQLKNSITLLFNTISAILGIKPNCFLVD